MRAHRTRLVSSYLIAVSAFFGLVTTSCSPSANTQVLVRVDADERLAGAGATLAVRACLQEDAPGCEGGYMESRTLDTEGAFPATIPVGPPAEVTDRFWLEVVLLDAAGQSLATSRVIAGFVSSEVRHVRVRLQSDCAGVRCGVTEGCFQGVCRDACFVPTIEDEGTPSTPVPCPGTVDAGASDAGVDPNDAESDGSLCDCECSGDECVDGVCSPRRQVQQVAAGRFHTCAVVGEEKQLYCWGQNTQGQLGLGPDTVGTLIARPTPVPGVSSVEHIELAAESTFALRTSGEALAWGGNAQRRLGVTAGSQPSPTDLPAPKGSTWAHLTSFINHGCGLTTDGGLYCWGAAEPGQTGAFDPPLPVTAPMPMLVDDRSWSAISVGSHFSCGILEMGGISCFGSNDNGKLAQPSSVRNTPRPLDVMDSPAAQVIEAGAHHACVVEVETGQMFCWGNGRLGRLGGESPVVEQPVPTLVAGGHVWRDMSLGGSHTCAVTDTSELYCWGDGLTGQLGTGGLVSQPTPVQVGGEDRWLAVGAGNTHTCALREDGALYCWGLAGAGQLGECPPSSSPCRVCIPDD